MHPSFRYCACRIKRIASLQSSQLNYNGYDTINYSVFTHLYYILYNMVPIVDIISYIFLCYVNQITILIHICIYKYFVEYTRFYSTRAQLYIVERDAPYVYA